MVSVKRLVLILLFFTAPILAEEITIQFKWYNKFQFAGYHAAQHQGYFEEEGLTVTLLEGGPHINHLHHLINDSSQYVTLGSESINSLALGSPVIIVASVFQHSPEVLMTLKKREITEIAQFKDENLMLADSSISGQIEAMLIKNALMPTDYRKQPYDGDVNKLIDQTVLAMYGYVSNEPYQLYQLGHAVDIFAPQDYGIDFYGDSLATTQSELDNHPERVASVRRAVIRGWNYALEHQEEIIDYILSLPTINPMPYDKDHQRYEASKTAELIDAKRIPLGYSSPDRWAAMFDTFNEFTGGQAVFSEASIYDEFYQDRSWIGRTLIAATIGLTLILVLYFWNRTLKMRLNRAVHNLQKVAFEDALTTMKNRSAMILFFEECRAKHKKNRYLAIIDIAELQKYNKTQGFQKADELIQQVARIVTVFARQGGHCYSLYGGKFAFICKASNQAEFEARVAKLAVNISAQISSIRLYFGGIKLEFGLDNSTLTTRSELALQRAKEMKSTELIFFNDTIAEEIELREQLLLQVKEGLIKQEFEAYYQPKIDSHDNKIKGLEALVRWNHPQQGLLRPAAFLPIVERSKELMMALENHIFETIMAQANTLIRYFSEESDFRLSINLSSIQFSRNFLVRDLLAVCQRFDVAPRYIEFELTESSMLENLETAIVISNQLQDAGFHVALDDFGTGYSSLSYLQNLPVNVIKLDYSFVKKLPHDERSGYVVEHIISLAHKLGLKIVAEGVEEQEQLVYLSRLGVDLVQGFYFYKPMPIEAVCKLPILILKPSTANDVY